MSRGKEHWTYGMKQQQTTLPNAFKDVVDDDSDDNDDDDAVDGYDNDYVSFPFSAYDYPICIHDYL